MTADSFVAAARSAVVDRRYKGKKHAHKRVRLRFYFGAVSLAKSRGVMGVPGPFKQSTEEKLLWRWIH
jgi:hypothetical protein